MSAYENRLVRTIYDYESNDDKILTFKSGDMFIILKPGDDYSYVVSAYGRLGYIPTSFFESTIVSSFNKKFLGINHLDLNFYSI